MPTDNGGDVAMDTGTPMVGTDDVSNVTQGNSTEPAPGVPDQGGDKVTQAPDAPSGRLENTKNGISKKAFGKFRRVLRILKCIGKF